MTEPVFEFEWTIKKGESIEDFRKRVNKEFISEKFKINAIKAIEKKMKND